MIQFTATPDLLIALDKAGILPSDYKPAYGGESIGLDLYYAGSKPIVVPTSHTGTQYTSPLKIPTGLKVALPPGHGGFIYQRGSIVRTPLIHRAGVIDPGFTKEIVIPIINLDPYAVYEIQPYSKLPFQLVVMPVKTNFCFIDVDTYEQTTHHAQRKEACFGSTDMVAAPAREITTQEDKDLTTKPEEKGIASIDTFDPSIH